MSSIPQALQEKIIQLLSAKTGKQVELKTFAYASGGCINQGGKLQTSSGVYFLKWNDAVKYTKMFNAEAKGLQILRATKTLRIPEVILQAETNKHQFLLLEFIESGPLSKIYWEEFGQQLAALHKHSAASFGLDHNNYIGSLPQSNRQHNNWVDFFIHERIEPLLKQSLDQKLCAEQHLRDCEELFKKFPSIFPDEPPALLHGDLWVGNLMHDEQGNPSLIDPAVYYGHREMDLAFTNLFGGFDEAFYKSYSRVFPLASGFKQRIDLYNLYPLLVHAILFGKSYMMRVLQTLKDYK